MTDNDYRIEDRFEKGRPNYTLRRLKFTLAVVGLVVSVTLMLTWHGGGLTGAQGGTRPYDDVRALLDETADRCELSGQARGERVLAGGGQRSLKIGLPLLRETGLAMSNEYERTSHRDPS